MSTPARPLVPARPGSSRTGVQCARPVPLGDGRTDRALADTGSSLDCLASVDGQPLPERMPSRRELEDFLERLQSRHDVKEASA